MRAHHFCLLQISSVFLTNFSDLMTVSTISSLCKETAADLQKQHSHYLLIVNHLLASECNSYLKNHFVLGFNVKREREKEKKEVHVYRNQMQHFHVGMLPVAHTSWLPRRRRPLRCKEVLGKVLRKYTLHSLMHAFKTKKCVSDNGRNNA